MAEPPRSGLADPARGHVADASNRTGLLALAPMANPALAPKRINATLEELEPGWAAPTGAAAATTIGAPPAARRAPGR